MGKLAAVVVQAEFTEVWNVLRTLEMDLWSGSVCLSIRLCGNAVYVSVCVCGGGRKVCKYVYLVVCVSMCVSGRTLRERKG